MFVTVKRAQPITPPIEEVTITMSAQDAQNLMELVSKIGGLGPIRNTINKLSGALYNVGFNYTHGLEIWVNGGYLKEIPTMRYKD